MKPLCVNGFGFLEQPRAKKLTSSPSYIRAYAIGVLSVVGRLSGAFAPVLVTTLANKDYLFGLLCISLFWLVGFFAFVIYAIKGKETKGMPIEQIS